MEIKQFDNDVIDRAQLICRDTKPGAGFMLKLANHFAAEAAKMYATEPLYVIRLKIDGSYWCAPSKGRTLNPAAAHRYSETEATEIVGGNPNLEKVPVGGNAPLPPDIRLDRALKWIEAVLTDNSGDDELDKVFRAAGVSLAHAIGAKITPAVPAKVEFAS